MKFSYLFMLLLLLACGSETEQDTTETKPKQEAARISETSESATPSDTLSFHAENLMEVDLDQDFSGMSVEEIRLMRNALFARQGYLFNKAEVRAYFSQTSWYDSLMGERWWAEDAGQAVAEIAFADDEQAFLDRAKSAEEALLANNFLQRGTKRSVNVANIVNRFQFQDLSPEFLDRISENGFVITPNDNIQLFHLYEQNDYQQVPSFVSTDMYLQLFHMFFSYSLRNVESGVFYERMQEVSAQMSKAALEDYVGASDERLKSASRFSSVFFAVATRLFGGKATGLDADLEVIVKDEYDKVLAARDDFSAFLGYANVYFPYSLFKPRGHYTRSETLQNYFRGMMWLQKGEMCLTEEQSFDAAIYMAHLMNKVNGLRDTYNSVYAPIKFIIGEPDNLSIPDVAAGMLALEMTSETLFEEVKRSALSSRLKALDRNRIKPKIQLSCEDKINLMPQRYLFDNEIIQELVDVDSDVSKRAYPKGIDVFGAMGVQQAERLLLEYYREAENWSGFQPAYDKLKAAHSDLAGKEATVYNRWMECLKVMQQPEDRHPYFMQTDGWEKKNLNTALASWAELKHDAILYAEQPAAAECGDGGPPPPITVGYVEPNLAFWKKLKALILLTKEVFQENDILLPKISRNTDQLIESVEFLIQVSEKELRGEKLSNEEYQTIEIIGSSVEYLTIGMLDNYVSDWDLVQGPDKKVAVVADIYTSNATNNPNKGILHVATGFVNDLYVVVEIEGYLYLTRGAVFTYHEFPEPMDSRLTDEAWQERLDAGKAPPVPKWMKDIMFETQAPRPNEKVFYSSGC